MTNTYGLHKKHLGDLIVFNSAGDDDEEERKEAEEAGLIWSLCPFSNDANKPNIHLLTQGLTYKLW